MNRLIKFRGKDDSGKWIYGSYIQQDSVIVSDEAGEVTVDPDTVGQFTGLLDKNGREVYDGDLILHESLYRGKVCWDEELLQWFVLFDTDDSDALHSGYECEILGSIHDNLKGGSNEE